MRVIVFSYPSEPHARRHGPVGYKDYTTYKPWLRDEFKFRCVYCLEREVWYPDGEASFSADHVVPQSEDDTRVNDYTNLIYACTRCNSYRRQIKTLDPTKVALGKHLKLEADGTLTSLTNDGKKLIKLLHLNEGKAMKTRQKYLRRARVCAEYAGDAQIDAMFEEDFGFPAELPDLRPLQPEDNTIKGSEHTCYFVTHANGDLPQVYDLP